MTPPARRRHWLALLVTAGLATVSGCAASAAGGGDDDLSCAAFVTVTPAAPVVGDTLVASIDLTGTATGLVSATWTVRDPAGSDVAVNLADPDGREVQFVAATAGTYDLTAFTTRGGIPCTGGAGYIYVQAPGAASAQIRLRYTPLVSQPAPPQEDPLPFTLYSGADMTLPPRMLDGGQQIAGALAGPGGALAAWLQLRAVGTGHTTELFADAAGAFAARIPTGAHDLTIVPYDPTVAPAALDAQTVAELAAGYTLDAGDAIGGVVLRADGTPLAGARVALGPAGLPASVVTSAADGTFSAHARTALGPLVVTVVPPAGVDLPTLEVPATLALMAGPGSVLELRLADAPMAAITGSVQSSDGFVLPGAQVTFVATSLTIAGQVTLDGGLPLPAPAAARITVLAGATGALPPLALPFGEYQVVVAPSAPASGETLSITGLDLSAGAPAMSLVLESAAAHATTITVLGAGGVALTGAHVTAVGRGLLGVGAGAAVSDTTDAQGQVTVSLGSALEYDLLVDPPRDAPFARVQTSLAGEEIIATVTLPTARRISGTLRFPSGIGQPGVRVAALCDGCTIPLAETITGAGGTFLLFLPEPQ